MKASRQIFIATSALVISGSVFGSILLLNQGVQELQSEGLKASGPSMTFGDPENPLCTVRVDSMNGPLAAHLSNDLWRIIMACEAAQNGSPSPAPSKPGEFNNHEIET